MLPEDPVDLLSKAVNICSFYLDLWYIVQWNAQCQNLLISLKLMYIDYREERGGTLACR